MVTILLDIPPRTVHPNARTHWANRAKATKAVRSAAFVTTINARAAGISIPRDALLNVRCRWYFRDRRHRDTDNLLAWLKAAFDGIADGLGYDDRRFVHWPAVVDCDRDRPRVEVDLWPIVEGQGATACIASPSSEPTGPC